MATKKSDKSSAAAKNVRLYVRTVAAHRQMPRYRAGLGPFWCAPVAVDATPEQAEALKADPALAVAEAGE